MVCAGVTTAVAGGGAEVVTNLVLGPRFLLAAQIPIPRQQQKHVQIKTRITTPTTIPVTETNHKN